MLWRSFVLKYANEADSVWTLKCWPENDLGLPMELLTLNTPDKHPKSVDGNKNSR